MKLLMESKRIRWEMMRVARELVTRRMVIVGDAGREDKTHTLGTHIRTLIAVGLCGRGRWSFPNSTQRGVLNSFGAISNIIITLGT